MKQNLKWITPKEAEKIPDGSVVLMRRVIHGENDHDLLLSFNQTSVNNCKWIIYGETAMFLVIETPKKKGKK